MSYLYLAGDLSHSSGDNGPISRVVLHATVSPCVPGGARSVARYFGQPTAGGLAHYVVDPGEVVQTAPESLCVWHAPPNKGSLGVELCDPQAGPAARWADAAHQAMLTRAAGLVADLCRRHDVPPVYIDRTQLLAGARGVTTHLEVAQAWHQSDHVDPGPAFPLGPFLALVRDQLQPPPMEDDVTPQDKADLIAGLVAAVTPVLDDRIRLLLRGDPTHPDSLQAIHRDTSALCAKLISPATAPAAAGGL